MDRRIIGMAWIAVAVIGIGAGPGRGPGWAEGMFARPAHDFGPVARGAKVRHAFILTNRLAEPVSIINVRASCGCTTGRAPEAPIAPSQSAVVEAEMDTSNFVGKKSTALFVTLVTARGKESEVRLSVSGTSLSDVVLNPGSIDFGTVSRGETPRRVLTIDRLGSPDWRAVRMISASRALDANLLETSRSAASVGYSLTVSLKPDAPAGPIRDEIRVLTNDAESPSIPILVTAQVRGGGLSATPSILALSQGKGPSASARAAQGRFLVRASQPFAIVTVEGAGEGFQVAADDTARKPTHVVTVSYRPADGAPRGPLRRSFLLHTDLPGEPPLSLTATVRAE